jgi:hypothetical protein
MFEILPNDQEVIEKPVEGCKGAAKQEIENATKKWKWGTLIPLVGAIVALALAVIGGIVSASTNYGGLADYKQTSIRWNSKQDVRLDSLEAEQKRTAESMGRIEEKANSNGKLLELIGDRKSTRLNSSHRTS